jgi:hypothetical protein
MILICCGAARSNADATSGLLATNFLMEALLWTTVDALLSLFGPGGCLVVYRPAAGGNRPQRVAYRKRHSRISRLKNQGGSVAICLVAGQDM